MLKNGVEMGGDVGKAGKKREEKAVLCVFQVINKGSFKNATLLKLNQNLPNR